MIKEMKNAINDIDLALHGDNQLLQMIKLFDDTEDDIMINVKFSAANLRQLNAALIECNRIANLKP